jgi:hypothetical protein
METKLLNIFVSVLIKVKNIGYTPRLRKCSRPHYCTVVACFRLT